MQDKEDDTKEFDERVRFLLRRGMNVNRAKMIALQELSEKVYEVKKKKKSKTKGSTNASESDIR